jgi:hypothetical protein
MLTQKQIKETFYYKDGQLFWNINGGPSIVKGSPVGTKNSEGYLQVKYGGKTYKVHRLIYMLHHDDIPEKVDHRDTNRLNNRIKNLRPATAEQNMQNRNAPSTNTSGFKGIDKFSGKWRARVVVDGNRHTIGLYDTAEEASKARDAVTAEHHGEFHKPS